MTRLLEVHEAGAGRILSAPANWARTSLGWVVGGVATVATLAVGAVLAVAFAAALVAGLVLAAALLVLTAAAWRIRRPAAVEGPVIEARKVGHSWVAYGWRQQP